MGVLSRLLRNWCGHVRGVVVVACSRQDRLAHNCGISFPTLQKKLTWKALDHTKPERNSCRGNSLPHLPQTPAALEKKNNKHIFFNAWAVLSNMRETWRAVAHYASEKNADPEQQPGFLDKRMTSSPCQAMSHHHLIFFPKKQWLAGCLREELLRSPLWKAGIVGGKTCWKSQPPTNLHISRSPAGPPLCLFPDVLEYIYVCIYIKIVLR